MTNFMSKFGEKEVAVKELILQGNEKLSVLNEKFHEFSHEGNLLIFLILKRNKNKKNKKNLKKKKKKVSIMSELNHPNIVTLYGITTTPQLRIVMEYCKLPDLRAHLSSQDLLPDKSYNPILKLKFCKYIQKKIINNNKIFRFFFLKVLILQRHLILCIT